ncbi:hypothetical protein ACVWVY_000410 [Bradyrhizobium sp. URHC0002]
MARSCQQNGTKAGSWRGQLQGQRPPERSQSVDHRRRGRAAAIAYAREGADVAINYYPDEEPDAQEVLKLIKDEGRNGVLIPGDLRDEAFCQKLVADAVKALGGLDVLICNAARQQAHDSIMDITSEAFDATMKTNIYAPFWMIKDQGCNATPDTWLGNHRDDLRAGLRSVAGSV